jgi:hypothetical protein
MLPLTETIIRSSFINASRREVKEAVLPDDLESRDWELLDYLGWRDPKFARRAYAILPLPDGEFAGVVFYAAGRGGGAGRRSSTVGILLCRDFQCSRNVRNDPPPAYEGFDVAAARERRVETLRRKAAGFADMLITGR